MVAYIKSAKVKLHPFQAKIFLVKVQPHRDAQYRLAELAFPPKILRSKFYLSKGHFGRIWVSQDTRLIAGLWKSAGQTTTGKISCPAGPGWYSHASRTGKGPLAQRIRAPDYGSGGHRFKSYRAQSSYRGRFASRPMSFQAISQMSFSRGDAARKIIPKSGTTDRYNAR